MGEPIAYTWLRRVIGSISRLQQLPEPLLLNSLQFMRFCWSRPAPVLTERLPRRKVHFAIAATRPAADHSGTIPQPAFRIPPCWGVRLRLSIQSAAEIPLLSYRESAFRLPPYVRRW